jgi:hypothetical protein
MKFDGIIQRFAECFGQYGSDREGDASSSECFEQSHGSEFIESFFSLLVVLRKQ